MNERVKIQINREKIKELREAKKSQHLLCAESKDTIAKSNGEVRQLRVESKSATDQIRTCLARRKEINRRLKELLCERNQHSRTSKSAYAAIKHINAKIRQLSEENRKLRASQ